ncbi:MAG: zf-HC2 domain-containing protein [Candidatus Binatota bacterium]|nr:zf-HC2 domain-containing protein [Candidatus Binatota bacterium]
MRCDQAQELITARLDNELSADEHSAIEAHLHTCGRCQRALTAESRLKQQLKLARQEVTAPAALRREIESEIASQPALAVKTEGGFAWWFSFRSWRPAFAVATLIIAIAAIFYAKSPQQDVGMTAIETHRDMLSGKTALVRYDDANRLRQELARAVGDRFTPIALDLSMMRLYPVSGFVQKIGDREVLVTVYQGAGPAITCFTLLGSESDAPERAERFYDADMKLNFYSFSQAGINAVLHSEGNIICILVSKMSPADIVALLRGKSAHA